MAFIFPGLLIVIFLFCLAFLYTEGMWSNAVRLINVLTAALLAMNFWEPLAQWLEGQMPSATYVWDMVALWGIFALSLFVFRTACRSASGTKVRFKKIAEQIGSAVFAALVGWVMVCFTTATLHTAPLAEKFLFGGFDAQKRMLFGTAPDRQWLGFVNMVSRGALRRLDTNPFDPDHQFISKYAERRAAFETQFKETGTVRASGTIDKR